MVFADWTFVDTFPEQINCLWTQDFQNHFMSSIDFPPILYIIYMFSNKANNYQIRRP
jgi:hypothetical protein